MCLPRRSLQSSAAGVVWRPCRWFINGSLPPFTEPPAHARGKRSKLAVASLQAAANSGARLRQETDAYKSG